jgi:hypothetical protein
VPGPRHERCAQLISSAGDAPYHQRMRMSSGDEVRCLRVARLAAAIAAIRGSLLLFAGANQLVAVNKGCLGRCKDLLVEMVCRNRFAFGSAIRGVTLGAGP